MTLLYRVTYYRWENGRRVLEKGPLHPDKSIVENFLKWHGHLAPKVEIVRMAPPVATKPYTSTPLGLTKDQQEEANVAACVDSVEEALMRLVI